MRLGTLVFCVTCLFLAWWSLYNRLQPINQAQRQKSAGSLAPSPERLTFCEFQWSRASASQAEARFKGARQLLFADREQILLWQDDVIRQASDLGLEVRNRFLSALHNHILAWNKEIDFVQARYRHHFPLADNFTNSFYQRLRSNSLKL